MPLPGWAGRITPVFIRCSHTAFCTRSYEVGNWSFSIICATEKPKSAKWRIAPPQAASKVKFDRAFLK